MVKFEFNVDIERDLSKALIPKEQIINKHNNMDKYNLIKNIKMKINGKKIIIDTIGELKKYIHSIKDIERLEKKLDENDYIYLHKWFEDILDNYI